MSISPLRLEADMMTSIVTPMVESASKRMCHLVGQPAPCLIDALEKTPLRFTLLPVPTRKIRVVQ